MVHVQYIDSHLRAIRISLMGKSNEAQNGAATVVHGLLRSVRGLKEKDQTYDVLLDLLETLSRELPAVRHRGVHSTSN